MITDTIILSKIQDALTQIRPYLEADGGDVSLIEVSDEYIAKVQLHGACRDCSMSMMTLKAGVEESIRRAVPEIKGVEAITPKKTEILAEKLVSKG
ncbi:MAG: NifU family protein [Bacteroidetes bacterium]|nr:NifU family protein [Bacteroidota bacterium]